MASILEMLQAGPDTPSRPERSMLLDWRGKEYTYTSGVVRWNEDTRIDTKMPICGLDTESTRRGGTGIARIDEELPDDVYECQCITWSTPSNNGIRWIAPGECPILAAVYELSGEFVNWAHHKHTWFVYVHNLGYDTPQLFKGRPDLMSFARTGAYDNAKLKDKPKPRKQGRYAAEYFIERIRGRDCFLRNRALFTGTAPHFTIRCYRNRKDYTDITFLDSGSFFRGSLGAIAEDLKLPVLKRERQADIGLKDYRLIAEDDPLKLDFTEYAIDDAVIVKGIGQKIVDLHEAAEFTKIRTSSPGFAHSYFTRQLGELSTVVFSGSIRREDMALILESYGGGRTGGYYHGPVRNLNVVDFASSYPASMTSLPTFGPGMKYRRLKGKELEWRNVWEWLRDFPCAFLRVDGIESDGKYPSLITLNAGKLTPVYGAFEGIATTGPEVYCGAMSGTLKITRVVECIICYDTEEKPSPFKQFAEAAYEQKKNSPKGSVSYILAKLLLNSAYGKWIQSTKPQLLGTDAEEFICSYPAGDEHNYGKFYLEVYATAQANGKDTLEELQEARSEILAGAYDLGLKIESKPLNKMDTTKKEFAPSAIPPAAALVTAISRARLRALIKCTGAVYWDTDSAFIIDKTPEEIEACFALGSKWIAPGLVPLRWGNELGEIDLELTGGIGYLAGTKRYHLEGTDDKGKEKMKQAIHGIVNMYSPRVKDKVKRRYAEAVIRNLATGKDSRYRTKPSPRKAKGTRDEHVGRFESHSVAPNFKLDERMNWERAEGSLHWIGTMKLWEELKEDNAKEA